MKTPLSMLALAITCACFASVPTSVIANDADNSGNNMVDRSSDAKTPESQSNEQSDVDITRAIRRAIVKDSSLSMYAHNVKIITTKDHAVYLRGAVPSKDEASKINDLAQQNSGGYPVKCQLSITNK